MSLETDCEKHGWDWEYEHTSMRTRVWVKGYSSTWLDHELLLTPEVWDAFVKKNTRKIDIKVLQEARDLLAYKKTLKTKWIKNTGVKPNTKGKRIEMKWIDGTIHRGSFNWTLYGGYSQIEYWRYSDE
ncbi:MAG: hypothetical protein JKY50_00235 [Oleispira sp.]|nr:hypothetical protein [Oleispira sp.]